MAKVLYGATIGDARGKAGAIVHSKNRFGSYLRSKVSAVQPRTKLALGVRGQLTNLSKGWQMLSATDQAGWIALASVNPVTDVFGNSQILTGHQFYVRVNRLLTQSGLTPLTAAPADQVVDQPATCTLTATASGTPTLSVAFTPTPAATDAVQIFATPRYSAGRIFARQLLKFINTSAPPVTSPIDILSLWQAKYGTLASGGKITVAIFFIGVNGAASQEIQDTSVVG